MTDGWTDRIAVANTRSQQYLPVQLSRVKMAHDKYADAFMLLYFLTAKELKKRTIWVSNLLVVYLF